MRTLSSCICGLLALLLLADPSTLKAAPVKIRAGWVGAPASIIPFMFAKEGLARHNGQSYVLEPIYFSGSPLEITAMANGELELGTLGYSTFSIAVLNAGLKDLKIVADEIADGVGDYFSLTYAVRKDSPIQKVEDLKNKVVATNAIGAGAYIPLEVMLRKSGLLPNRDYRVVETQFANMKPMLLESKVDLATATLPFVLDPELQAGMRVLFRAREAMGVTALSFWLMRADFIAANRAAVVDLLEDYVRATRWFLDPANRAEAVDIIARFTKQPPERIASFVFTTKDFYRSPDVLPDFAALQKNVDAQRDIGLIKGGIRVADHAEPALLREATQRIK
jgi:ABC-type nitrate/sulfonate/bicarbonate transport system substrate-binding protein